MGLLGADEDADAMLRVGIKITHGFANPVYHEAVRRQRAQRFFPSRIVGNLDTKTGGRQIKAVLFQGQLAWRLRSGQAESAKQQHNGWKQAQGPEAMDPNEMPMARCDRPDVRCWRCEFPCYALPCFARVQMPRTVCQDCVDVPRAYLDRFRDQQSEWSRHMVARGE
jgi:hypothetical protein